MRTVSFRIGSVWGVPISIDVMWFVTFIFVSGVCGTIFPKAPALGLAMALCIYASVIAHELAHVAVAAAKGVQTEEILLGMFGGTAIMKEEPRDAGAIAAAGPALSVAVGGAFGAATLWLLWRHPNADLMTSYPILFIAIVATWNIGFAAFNMLPIYPLDGGRILHWTLLRRGGNRLKAIRTAATVTVVLAGALAAASVWQIASTHKAGAVLRLGMGLFLITQAIGSYRAERRRSEREGATTRKNAEDEENEG